MVIPVQDPVFEKNGTAVRRRRHAHNYAERLHRISHILHYCSIAILGIFAFQVQINNARSRRAVADPATLRHDLVSVIA